MQILPLSHKHRDNISKRPDLKVSSLKTEKTRYETKESVKSVIIKKGK